VNSSPDVVTAAAVVVAGGSGRRMGGVAKQFLEVGGQPILRRALLPFVEHPDVHCVVVVLPSDDAAAPPPWLAELPVRVVAGGAERSDSVWNGLAALPPGIDLVLVHDGARPFVSRQVIDRVLYAARDGAAIAAVPVADTIKEVDGSGAVIATPERARLWQAQTPQGFRRALLVRAHRAAREAGIPATDDAVLVERLGTTVRVVEGAAENIKVTRPVDLVFAEALAARVPAA
jgi:2-C-methyl-D-erythritol 4-phosphate cytidylyltransferase